MSPAAPASDASPAAPAPAPVPVTPAPTVTGNQSAPVRFGVGFDVGGAFVVPSGGPAAPGLDMTLGVGVSGGHFGGVVAFRGVLGNWLLGDLDLLGRYYLLDRRSSPFASLAFMPWMAPLPSNAPASYHGTSGVGVGFELGEELLRASDAVVRFKARVDLPFFSARDSSGDLRSFWVGSLSIELVARKFPDNFWML